MSCPRLFLPSPEISATALSILEMVKSIGISYNYSPFPD
jgi:hypothetical protein